MALQWQSATIPLAAGLSQRSDPRASNPPTLDVCLDAQFDLVGGIQTRHPYAALNNNILGGGTLANCRRIIAYNNELVCLTIDTLYSWSAEYNAWVAKGTNLAAKVSEQSVFPTPGDQRGADRAELNGIVIYAWVETFSIGDVVIVAAMDAATGAVVFSSTGSIFGQSNRPRLVALQSRILLFVQNGSDSITSPLLSYSIDPANIQTSINAGFTIVAPSANFGHFYDVVAIPGVDTAAIVMRRATTTSYDVGTVTAGNVATVVNKARACSGVAISASPSGTSLTVAKWNGSAITADLIITSSLADGAHVGVALGTTATGNAPVQIAAAHRTVQVGGQWTCYVFWDNGGTPPNSGGTATMTDGGTGAAGPLLPVAIGVASRAFDRNGRVYFWGVFAESTTGFSLGNSFSLQDTYFLFRDDLFLCAKATDGNAGGFAALQCNLPGVAVTGTGAYAFCGGARRIIQLGSPFATSYAARTPHDVLIAFDSNESRRSARLGETLYLTGGEVLQYDGAQLTECGFHIYPWIMGIAMAGSGGSLTAGKYAYKQTFRWVNGKGESERSTTATVVTVTAVANDEALSIATPPLSITHKNPSSALVASTLAVEAWRTAVNPTLTAPFYLVTSKDPSVTANPNRYLANDPTVSFLPALVDAESDATATTNEANPENSGVLSCLSPPAATVIAATDVRVFLAGIAGAPDTVWYSRQRNTGEIISFNDGLTFDVPRDGGDITAIAFTVDGTTIVFRQSATYAFPGVGFDNTGGGSSYGPARILSTDVGCVSADAIALTDAGHIFKSERGWHRLGPNLEIDYIGAPVYAYDAETILSVVVMTAQQQVRIMTSGPRVLVYDFNVGQWFEWSITDGIHACVWNGVYTYLTATGPKQELASLASVNYGMDVELAWLKPSGDQSGECSVRWVMPLGEFRSACSLRMRFARDYQYDGAGNPLWYDDVTWAVTPTTVGSAIQVRRGPSQPKCEAIKIRLTVTNVAGESLRLTGVGLQYGVKPGLYKRLSAAQKV